MYGSWFGCLKSRLAAVKPAPVQDVVAVNEVGVDEAWHPTREGRRWPRRINIGDVHRCGRFDAVAGCELGLVVCVTMTLVSWPVVGANAPVKSATHAARPSVTKDPRRSGTYWQVVVGLGVTRSSRVTATLANTNALPAVHGSAPGGSVTVRVETVRVSDPAGALNLEASKPAATQAFFAPATDRATMEGTVRQLSIVGGGVATGPPPAVSQPARHPFVIGKVAVDVTTTGFGTSCARTAQRG